MYACECPPTETCETAIVAPLVTAETVPVRTVNRQCSSGLQAIADVAAAIKAGFYNIGSFGSIVPVWEFIVPSGSRLHTHSTCTSSS